jgi:ABC-type anion transport system duplicated permease subunit
LISTSDIFFFITTSDIFSINKLTLILENIDECNIKMLNTNKNNNISYEGLDISLVQSDSLEN